MLRQDVFSTQEFKNMSERFAFCEIDLDQNPDAMGQFGVKAIPLILFLTADGARAHESVGGRAAAAFIQEMEKGWSAGE